MYKTIDIEIKLQEVLDLITFLFYIFYSTKSLNYSFLLLFGNLSLTVVVLKCVTEHKLDISRTL